MWNDYVDTPLRPEGPSASRVKLTNKLQYHTPDHKITIYDDPSYRNDTPVTKQETQPPQQLLATPALMPHSSMKGAHAPVSVYNNPNPMPPVTLPVPQPDVRHAGAPPVTAQAQPLTPSYSLPTPAPHAPMWGHPTNALSPPEHSPITHGHAAQASMPYYPTPDATMPYHPAFTQGAITLPSPAQVPRGSEHWPITQVHAPPASTPYPQAVPRAPLAPMPSSVISGWVPNSFIPSPLSMRNTVHNQAAQAHTSTPVHPQMWVANPPATMYAGETLQTKPLPPATDAPMHSYLPAPQHNAPVMGTAHSGCPPVTYSGFTQTHQVKNVQVFSGNADCKMLVDDWIRDMQYLLEAIGLPMHLRFSTVVRHLSGEARRLVLNLPPHEQTPENAFEELRAEYSDTQGSLDPLADFYERSQRSGESACSYAIALEATLRSVEETQRGGETFPDRDSKLTRQFLRGLTDEDTYARIAPMKPRLLGFRELQAELRNLSRENKKLQSHKPKKTYTQVHVTAESGPNVKADRPKHNSELSELTEMVKKLAHSQEEQLAKLAQLESRIATPAPAVPMGPQQFSGNSSSGRNVTCHRCGKWGHISRVCRAVLPESNQGWARPPLTVTAQDDNTPQPAQPLNA